MKPTDAKTRHLYVHLPFCPSICPYCSFHVLRVSKDGILHLIPELEREFLEIRDHWEPSTLFLGGGTPTILSLDQLEKIFTFLLPEGKNPSETTMECNPSTLSPSKARQLVQKGVNRISIGAQSFDPEDLKKLGRRHSASHIKDCFHTARDAGFQNINLDLIFGVPGQTLETWKKNLEQAVALKPQHLSCYGLTYEEDTDFFRLRQEGRLHDNPREAEMFEFTRQFLGKAGYRHYEISNFALPGFECRHNLAYWNGADFLGIGPGAVSTRKGVRRRNSHFDGRKWKVEETEILPPETLASERMALGLRMDAGVDATAFERDFGHPPSHRWGKEIQQLVQEGLLVDQASLRLTPAGWAVADEIAVRFM